MTYESHQEWIVRGRELFGPDPMKWRFRCPMCKAIRTPEDFRPFKTKGATADSAATECLGRYTGGASGPHRCDWAAYGLFRGPDLIAVAGGEKAVFEFAPEEKVIPFPTQPAPVPEIFGQR